MAVSYNKLWKLLVDKKMSKSDLRKRQKLLLTQWQNYVVMKK